MGFTGQVPNLVGHKAYSSSEIARWNPLDEQTTRSALHNAGFFEISATATSLSTNKTSDLPTTRFHLTRRFYDHLPAKQLSEKFTSDAIWYFAKRGASYSQQESH